MIYENRLTYNVMDKLIILDEGTKKKICACYGVTAQYLNKVLKFKGGSRKAIAMRSMALQNGGSLYVKVENPKILGHEKVH
jgi:hypothetical protein